MSQYRFDGKALGRRIFILLNALFVFTPVLFARFDFNENCRGAYRSLITLHFDQARLQIAQEKKSNPDNLIPLYLDNYIDFLTVFIGEEQSAFEQFGKMQEIRMDAIRKGDKSSPWIRYCQANMRIQFALCRTKFGEYKSAAIDISRANSELKENERLYPGFLIQKTGLGLIHTIGGIIPENYGWMKKLLGFEGDLKQGLDEMARVAQYTGTDPTYRLFASESLFYLSFLTTSMGTDAEKSLQMLNEGERQRPDVAGLNSPLMIFVRASLEARAGKCEAAIGTLQKYHPDSSEYPFCFLEYMLGVNKLNRLDEDADLYLIRFIKDFRGKNYVKSAYQKLAWAVLLKGNRKKYEEYIAKAATRGASLIEADRVAEREATSGEIPNLILLRARLLSDGGYFQRALAELNGAENNGSMVTPKDKLEFSYRLGRIYQQSHEYPQAIRWFDKVIIQGSSSPWYFAANAALQSALIREEQKNYPEAERYFRLCLSMSNTEYKKSLDQKARLGLKRIKPFLP
jgi:tetratricopeptide (TPR) repeat protein